jgi:hypothetical protein
MNNNPGDTEKKAPQNTRRRFQRVYATEAEREAVEKAERIAEKEMFEKEWTPLEESRLSKLRHGMKQPLVFTRFAFSVYFTVVLILSTIRADFPFFNGALIIYASVYFVAFLIYFVVARIQD